MIPGEQNLFDLSFLEQMDDKDFIVQVITLYVTDTQTDLDEVKRAFANNDIETVYKTCHKLKSSTGMLQANGLYALLEKTEKTAKAGGDKQLIGELIQQVFASFNVLKPALEEHLVTLQATS